MIKRDLSDELITLTTEYPVVTVLGPRQAGKTTITREVLPGYEYSNLEAPEVRHFAESDPKAYLAQFKSKVIIDEVQRVPELLSYIQVIVDVEQLNGRFILTGSHQLKLREAVSQSLAGRTAILHLLPFSIPELKNGGVSFDTFDRYCFTGFLPRIYDQEIRPGTAYSNYYQTYVERDVRLLITLKDVSLFEKLLKLIAGRVGQVIDYTSLANDVGVDQKTIKHWLAILEASFILFKLPPYFDNLGKRVIKSPKYYFTDVGLLCFILGIRKEEQVSRDPLVGSIFENLVVLECLKARYHRGQMSDLYFFRDSNGNEIDILYQDGRELIAIEVKSSQTFANSQLKGLRKFKGNSDRISRSVLVYSGDNLTTSDGIEVINFAQTHSIF
jgi:uncharacterized protein